MSELTTHIRYSDPSRLTKDIGVCGCVPDRLNHVQFVPIPDATCDACNYALYRTVDLIESGQLTGRVGEDSDQRVPCPECELVFARGDAGRELLELHRWAHVEESV